VYFSIVILCFILAAIIVTSASPPADKTGEARAAQKDEDEALVRARKALAALPEFVDTRGDKYCVYQTLRLTMGTGSAREQTMEFRYASLPQELVRLPATVSPVGGTVIVAKSSDRANNQGKGSLFFASVHPQFRELLASKFERLAATNRKTAVTVNFDLRNRGCDQQVQAPSVEYYTFFDDSLEVYGETGGARQLVFDRSCVSGTK
jgi:hypothetical protein